MRSSLILRSIMTCGALSISLLTSAQPIKTPTLNVVYDSGKTIDATRYYTGRMRSSETPGTPISAPVAPAKPQRSLKLGDRLPLRTDHLAPGQLEIREVAGLYTPFFVLGMDSQSLVWFEDAADTLSAMNASGFVVEASNRNDWFALKARAQDYGINLSLLDGTGLARMYGFETYPTVFVKEQAQ